MLISDAEWTDLRRLVEEAFFDSCLITTDGAITYDGACAFSDDGEAIERMQAGDVGMAGDGVLTLPYGTMVDQDRALVELTHDGVIRPGRFTKVRYLETCTRALVEFTAPAEVAP